jgi:hypothetical protein
LDLPNECTSDERERSAREIDQLCIIYEFGRICRVGIVMLAGESAERGVLRFQLEALDIDFGNGIALEQHLDIPRK